MTTTLWRSELHYSGFQKPPGFSKDARNPYWVSKASPNFFKSLLYQNSQISLNLRSVGPPGACLALCDCGCRVYFRRFLIKELCAIFRGSLPSLFSIRLLHTLKRNWTAFSNPIWAARWSAVLPSVSWAFISAPCSASVFRDDTPEERAIVQGAHASCVLCIDIRM